MQQQQYSPSGLHHHHQLQENMGIYDINYVFFPPPDQTPFYPVPSAYGFPIYPEFNQPGYDSHDFFFPCPLQYYYGHPPEGMYYPPEGMYYPPEGMYYHQNDNYHLDREQNLQWPPNHLQESDQVLDILSRFSFVPEDETAILDLDAEETYPLGNQLPDSDEGRNIFSRLTFTSEDGTAILDLDVEDNFQLGNQLQGSDQIREISWRLTPAQEDDTSLLQLDVDFISEEGNLPAFSTTIPADHPIVEVLQQSFQEDRISENNGLPEATISKHLKTRNYHTLADQEPEICIVCQQEYENEETIGTLECGHEYHADCIKGWLMKKNVCPLCKREGVQEKS